MVLFPHLCTNSWGRSIPIVNLFPQIPATALVRPVFLMLALIMLFPIHDWTFWRGKFPMTSHCCLLIGWLVGQLVGRSGWSVCRDFLKVQKVTFPLSYRSTLCVWRNCGPRFSGSPYIGSIIDRMINSDTHINIIMPFPNMFISLSLSNCSYISLFLQTLQITFYVNLLLNRNL